MRASRDRSGHLQPGRSARGIQAYAATHGLVIIRRKRPARLSRPAADRRGHHGRALIAWLSRGRLTDEHDELLYVIRKPEDRFARLV